MKLKIKAMLTVLLVLVVLTCAAGCSEEASPYQVNDADAYNVSVRFDANGGFFATNTSVIVDSYNISQMQADGSGNVQLALLSPDNAVRGIDAYTATNPGYFLAGWYAQRIETADGYTYGQKWNFETDRLSVAANGTYSAAEPVLTLYAVWVPVFQIEFYNLSDGQLLETYTFNPANAEDILVPHWNEETGAVEMYDFPELDGYTFSGAYYDAAGTQPVDTPNVIHTGKVDEATGVAQNASMKLYVDYMEGEWYHIYNAEQFLDHASVTGNYVIHADLDFTDAIWPTSLMHGNFSGTIEGNGHTFSNIMVEQTNNSKVNAGLFGTLTENAKITDLTLDNVTVTIKAGTRMAGTSFGLLAGVLSDQAQITGLTITNSQLLIDANAYFGTDDYVIGLLCGMGSADVDISGISCAIRGETDSLWLTVADGEVILSDTPPAEVSEATAEEPAA